MTKCHAASRGGRRKSSPRLRHHTGAYRSPFTSSEDSAFWKAGRPWPPPPSGPEGHQAPDRLPPGWCRAPHFNTTGFHSLRDTPEKANVAEAWKGAPYWVHTSSKLTIKPTDPCIHSWINQPFAPTFPLFIGIPQEAPKLWAVLHLGVLTRGPGNTASHQQCRENSSLVL